MENGSNHEFPHIDRRSNQPDFEEPNQDTSKTGRDRETVAAASDAEATGLRASLRWHQWTIIDWMVVVAATGILCLALRVFIDALQLLY